MSPDAARDFPETLRPGLSTVRTASGEWRIFALQGRGQTVAVAQPTAVRARLAAAAALRTVIPFLLLLPLVVIVPALTETLAVAERAMIDWVRLFGFIQKEIALTDLPVLPTKT